MDFVLLTDNSQDAVLRVRPDMDIFLLDRPTFDGALARGVIQVQHLGARPLPTGATQPMRQVIYIPDAAEGQRLFTSTGTSLNAVHNNVMVAIDKVHRVPDSTHVPVQVRPGTGHIAGGYEHGDYQGQQQIPIVIRVAAESRHPHVTVAHELAHYLDEQVFGGRRGFGSQLGNDPATNRAVDAMRQTRLIRDVAAFRQALPANSPLRIAGMPAREYIDGYYLTPPELFARGYVQYVTMRSRSRFLEAEARDIEAEDRRLPHPARERWAPADFAPVASAYDALFARYRR